jgi:glutamate synthase domain-containing protein 3
MSDGKPKTIGLLVSMDASLYESLQRCAKHQGKLVTEVALECLRDWQRTQQAFIDYKANTDEHIKRTEEYEKAQRKRKRLYPPWRKS